MLGLSLLGTEIEFVELTPAEPSVSEIIKLSCFQIPVHVYKLVID